MPDQQQQDIHPSHFHLDKKVNLMLIVTIIINLIWGGYLFGIQKTILDSHTKTISEIIQTQKKLTDSTINLGSAIQSNTFYINNTSKNLADVTKTLKEVNENQIRLQSKLEK